MTIQQVKDTLCNYNIKNSVLAKRYGAEKDTVDIHKDITVAPPKPFSGNQADDTLREKSKRCS